ncbi:hypothetical protein L202_07200 [Cryptococcus amylolentus CBS 6039]|uniref:D-isomer specific 2-hydroxyacid dehydrogenase NAD-binding domain-containing protein n=1 Tax=Cryptococcus amylolentus CBS 6039 TaxID=1295533 RepID=A0A1E3HEY7_9TREE|nr:hypothetical protein L202_07200 [Cryptococcus amylolentus CBS 6039]ODN74897.1 hypothetical protein L202_07200 [Cryptococcus amylolentus CBS 6039]
MSRFFSSEPRCTGASNNVPIQTCIDNLHRRHQRPRRPTPKSSPELAPSPSWSTVLPAARARSRPPDQERRVRAVHQVKALSPGLFGKVVGLVGMGDISYEVGKLVTAFGCQVVVFSPTSPPTRWTSSNARYQTPLPHTRASSLEDLRQVDVVFLHCPLIDSTRNLMGREPGVDEGHRSGGQQARGGLWMGGRWKRRSRARSWGRRAGLDVFVLEPAYGESLGGLRELDNNDVVLLPHL